MEIDHVNLSHLSGEYKHKNQKNKNTNMVFLVIVQMVVL